MKQAEVRNRTEPFGTRTALCTLKTTGIYTAILHSARSVAKTLLALWFFLHHTVQGLKLLFSAEGLYVL